MRSTDFIFIVSLLNLVHKQPIHEAQAQNSGLAPHSSTFRIRSKTKLHVETPPKHVIISADSSGGAYGIHAAYDECPNPENSGDIIHHGPRDIDDLMALVLAINSDLEIDSIVCTYGNACMATNFMMATQVVHNIKQRRDIPIFPGSMSQSQPVFVDAWRFVSHIDETGWGSELPISDVQKPSSPPGAGSTIDPVTLFKMSCKNVGVLQIEEQLRRASREGYKENILGMGPLTDIACLLLNLEDGIFDAIEDVVILGGQEADKPVLWWGGVQARDFNVALDPMAAAIVLSFADRVNIVLMQYGLTGLTTNSEEFRLLFNDDTFLPNTLHFFRQAKQNALPEEGPFDQYVVAYILHPEWFVCPRLPAYVIQCSGETGDDSAKCTTKAPNKGVKGVSAELTVDPTNSYSGPLVTGDEYGNILNFRKVGAPTVKACGSFSEGSFDDFREWVYALQ